MRREGREIIGHILLIAHDCDDRIEPVHACPVRGGDRETCTHHHAHEADGLQADGLTSGVGACEDDTALGVAQAERVGDDVDTTQAQHGMLGVAECTWPWVPITGRVAPSLRPRRALALARSIRVAASRPMMSVSIADFSRHLSKNLRDGTSQFGVEALDLILLLHDSGGLDKPSHRTEMCRGQCRVAFALVPEPG